MKKYESTLLIAKKERKLELMLSRSPLLLTNFKRENVYYLKMIKNLFNLLRLSGFELFFKNVVI